MGSEQDEMAETLAWIRYKQEREENEAAMRILEGEREASRTTAAQVALAAGRAEARLTAKRDRLLQWLAGGLIVIGSAWTAVVFHRIGFDSGARAHADGKVVVTGSGVHQGEVERAK